MKTFLENGADVHVRDPGIVEVNEPLQIQAKSGPVLYTEMRLYHEVSPLWSIRRWLEYTPERKEVEEMLLAKGNRSSNKLSLAALGTGDYRWYRIPKRQYNKIIAASNVASHREEITSYMPGYCE